jgi:uncharacterized protein (TIGR02266 family)
MDSRKSQLNLNIAAEETYRDGTVIFEEGSSGDWIYIVLEGKVEIYKMISGKKIVVDLLEAGDLFGEVSFIDKQPRSASARAIGKVTVGIYDRQFLTQAYNMLPTDFKNVFDYLARRLRKVTTVAATLAGRRTERVDHAFEIEYKKAEDFFTAYSANIGGGGVFIKTQALLPTGSQVNLRFNLPGDPAPIHTAARIVWHAERGEPGMGAEFLHLSPADQIRINAFLRRAKGN